MQIDNYGDLKQAVSLWLNRKDSATVNNIPLFINFAEKQFTRLVKLPYYEALSEFTIGGNFKYIVIPQDMLSVKHLLVNGHPYNRVDVETFMRAKNYKDKSDKPPSAILEYGGTINIPTYDMKHEYKRIFTRIGGQLHMLPTPEVGSFVELIYIQDIPEMFQDNDQPYSLLIAPEIMLYLALRHASIFIRDVEMERYWMEKAQEAADSLSQQIDDAEWNGSSIAVQEFDPF